MNTLQTTIPTHRVRVSQATTQTDGDRHCVVTHAVLLRLRTSSYYALRSLTCEFRSGQLYLDGNVPSYYMKQMAQETVRHDDRVEGIINRVVVRYLD